MENNELRHYGVPGMKWGVRKASSTSSRQEYRRDKKIRRSLEADAYDAGAFARKYSKKTKQMSKKTSRKVEKDLDKTGEVSKKTQTSINTTKQLQKDRDAFTNANRQSVDRLEKHVNDMVNKYSDRSVKSINYKVKDGEKYLNRYSSLNSNAGYRYDLIKTLSVDNTGNKVYRYKPVKTKTYYY